MAPNEDVVEERDPAEAPPPAVFALPAAEGDRSPTPRVVAPAPPAAFKFRGVPVAEIAVVVVAAAAAAAAAAFAALGVVDEKEEADCSGPFPPADAACKV